MKRTPLRRRTRLASASPRRLADMDARRACMEVVRARDATCRATGMGGPCAGPLDGHEPLTRARGGDPTDPDQVILVCRRHHDLIHHADPARAHELGLLIHSWEPMS